MICGVDSSRDTHGSYNSPASKLSELCILPEMLIHDRVLSRQHLTSHLRKNSGKLSYCEEDKCGERIAC